MKKKKIQKKFKVVKTCVLGKKLGKNKGAKYFCCLKKFGKKNVLEFSPKKHF